MNFEHVTCHMCYKTKWNFYKNAWDIENTEKLAYSMQILKIYPLLKISLNNCFAFTYHIHTYIIDHYNPSVGIIDLVSHTTYVVCVNFIQVSGATV